MLRLCSHAVAQSVITKIAGYLRGHTDGPTERTEALIATHDCVLGKEMKIK